MRIRLLVFAQYRDLIGRDELELDVPAGLTAAGALAFLREREPRLGRLPAEPALAVNRVYADGRMLLQEGDELALLPPVAGG